jgi:hypothetical protein
MGDWFDGANTLVKEFGPMQCYQNFINNRFIQPESDVSFIVADPATGQPCAQVSAATTAEALSAVEAATAAQKLGCLACL